MIIFGLGNPGKKYRSTRHNAGYAFLDQFAKLYKKRFRMHQGYKRAKLIIGKKEVYLIKPQCWMNRSGVAISKVLQKVSGQFLIVVDDINLPVGKIRLRGRGSDGGHLGLRSLINSLESSNFARLRIGVGYTGGDVASYVLRSFKRSEKKILKKVIDNGIRGIELLIRKDFTKAQSYINGIDLTVKPETRNPEY